MGGFNMHFEKRIGKNFHYRSIVRKGSSLAIVIGDSNGGFHEFQVKCKSVANAKKVEKNWHQLFMDRGFVQIGTGDAIVGVISTLQSPEGPGRIRRDGPGEDLYFSKVTTQNVLFKQKERVLCEGVKKNAKPKSDFMFGSKWEANLVKKFPKVDWKKIKPLESLKPVDKAKLMKAYKEAISKAEFSNAKSFKSGDLIFAYDKGVHRVLSVKKYPGGFMVTYEPVFDSKFNRVTYGYTMAIEKFCAPLPADFLKMIKTCSPTLIF